MTFGVFQEYYSRQPEFEASPNIALVGVVPTSIYYLGAPLATPLVKKYQRWQRHMVVAGTVICVSSLLAASCVSDVTGLIATQGVMYGVGFSILYFPVAENAGRMVRPPTRGSRTEYSPLGVVLAAWASLSSSRSCYRDLDTGQPFERSP